MRPCRCLGSRVPMRANPRYTFVSRKKVLRMIWSRLRVKIAGGEDGVGMNGHSVLHPSSITPGEGDGNRDAATAGGFKHHAVALLPALERQREPTELVFHIRISAC